jgi:hypothetical protein
MGVGYAINVYAFNVGHVFGISALISACFAYAYTGVGKCPNICPTMVYYVRALDRCYQYTAL